MRLDNRRPGNDYERRVQLLRNASFVAFESRKLAHLKKWEREHPENRVIYVFDTDVIKTYSAPWLTGPVDDRSGRNGYGQIMPAKSFAQLDRAESPQEDLVGEKQLSEAVGWMLASKAIGTAFAQGDPPYQLEAHDLETQEIYTLVKRDAEAEAGDLDHSRNARAAFLIERTLRVLRADLTSTGESFLAENPGAYLLRVLANMHRNDFRGRRQLREWDAYMSLQSKSKGIFKIREYVPPHSDVGNGRHSAMLNILRYFKPGITDPLAQQFADIVARENHAFSQKSIRDAQALAELSYLNSESARYADGRYRIVLVTGDRNLVLRLSNSERKLHGTDDSVAAFTDAHVLHLWSMIDQVAQPTASQDNNVPQEPHTEWLNMFLGFLALPDAAEGASVRDQLLRGVVDVEEDKVAHLRSEDVDAADQKWREFATLAVSEQANFSDNPELLKRLVPSVLKKLQHSPGRVLDREYLLALVRESLARARDRSNVIFSDLGASAILAAHQNGVRNPPDLMFDSQVHTNRFFKDLARPKRIFKTVEDFSMRFDQVREDCYVPNEHEFDDDDRQESYLKYLVLGALFASANRWMVAEQHAASALEIVKRSHLLRLPIRTKSGNISGREAYFLLAVARRVRADHPRDFDKAERWLSLARSRLDSDRTFGAKSVPYVRFDCENLALSLSRYYYASTAERGSTHDRLAAVVVSNAETLISNVSAVERELRGEGATISLPISTQVNIAANLMQVFVISRYRARLDNAALLENPVSDDLLRFCLDIVVDNTDYNHRLIEIGVESINRSNVDLDRYTVICSPLILRYTATAAKLLNHEYVWKPHTTNDVDRLFDPSIFGNVTSYDETRYKVLHDFLLSL